MQQRPRQRRFFRRRKAEPKAAGDALATALQRMGLTDQAHRLRVAAAWPRAVGPRIAARTTPHQFSRGVLTIKTSSAAWQNELTYLKAELVDKLNAALGRKTVREIRIIAGAMRPADIGPPQLPALTDSDRQRIRHVAEQIDDPEIRDGFSRLMELEHRARRRL